MVNFWLYLRMAEKRDPHKPVPRWAQVIAPMAIILIAGAGGLIFLDETGPLRWWGASFGGLAVCGALLYAVGLAPCAHRDWSAGGTIVLKVSWAVVVGCVGGFVLVIALGISSLLLLIAGVEPASAARNHGAMVIMSLFTLPTLWRLVTGQLHNGRITLGQSLIYRTHRNEYDIAWSRIRSLRLTPRQDIVLRTGGRDIILPCRMFRVRGDQLHDEILRRRSAAR